MTWPQILVHPFIQENILIVDDHIPEFAFTHPMNDDDRLAKEKQAARAMHKVSIPASAMSSEPLNLTAIQIDKNIASSQDSINAILQSDIEQIETDFEDISAREKTAFRRYSATENPNLVLKYLDDNFVSNNPSVSSKLNPVEHKKLNQNLDNFSVRLGNTAAGITPKKGNESLKIQKEIEGTDKITPTVFDDDLSKDAQNPPIENEEWLVFIRKTMQEVTEGDLESLKQHNFVSIIVAPLRNSKTSAKVIKTVSQLFMLPFVISATTYDVQAIKKVSLSFSF